MKREGIVHGMCEAEYHAPKDELSSTGAKLLLESPAKFKHQIIDGHRVHRDAYDIGTAVHTKVLGTGISPVTCPEEYLASNGAMSTKAAREWKAEQVAAGIPVVSASDLVAIDAMAESVLAHLAARKLLEREGHAEVSVFDEYLGVKRRGRFDYLPDEGGIAVDLKTTLDASRVGFMKSAAQHGYHIQRGHYIHILRQLGREVEMTFILVEKEAPYLTAVRRLDEQFRDMGETEALEAVDEYRRCVESGEWPGYGDEITETPPPMYLIYDYQDRYENEEIQVNA